MVGELDGHSEPVVPVAVVMVAMGAPDVSVETMTGPVRGVDEEVCPFVEKENPVAVAIPGRANSGEKSSSINTQRRPWC